MRESPGDHRSSMASKAWKAPRREEGVPRLYALADVDLLGAERLPDALSAMAESGVEWIQIRAKHTPSRSLFTLLEACFQRLEGGAVSLWINDRSDLAKLFPASGVHVGQTDLPPEAVRQVVGPRVWIGRSTHDLAQVKAANADPDVDVIAYGPIFTTTSKDDLEPTVGLDGLLAARRLTSKPLVAIGGMKDRRLLQALAAGADTVAVLGAICRGDVGENCRRLLRICAEHRPRATRRGTPMLRDRRATEMDP